MLYTNVQIMNIGLSGIGSSQITRIDPPRTSLERHCAANYLHWRRSEIGMRRWVFATEDNVKLTQTAILEGVEQKYVYALPSDCLRPLRTPTTEWKQRGRSLYSRYDTLCADLLLDKDESEFDPLFVGVLAARVGLSSVEFNTQSNTKKDLAMKLYDEAVDAAALANAFVRGPEDVDAPDEGFEFLAGRY